MRYLSLTLLFIAATSFAQQQDDAERRLQALEKQRTEQASEIQQQCGDQSSGCKQGSGWLCM